jgi:3-hydroxybutyrate dehydrogenase
MNLSGKVALIMGPASGIGYAIAKRFLEADGRVVIAVSVRMSLTRIR